MTDVLGNCDPPCLRGIDVKSDAIQFGGHTPEALARPVHVATMVQAGEALSASV
jgi:hypothetical protein